MVEIVRTPLGTLPLNIQAVILEEDTGLVLSAEVRLKEDSEHPVRVMTDLVSFEFPKVGSAVLQNGSPLFIFAVVHDLEQTPHCNEQWVSSALEACFCICQERGVEHLAVQQLGCVFGNLNAEWFESELKRQLANHCFQTVCLIDR